MSQEYKFVAFTKLLSKQQIRELSPAACLLFGCVWNRMKMRSAIEASVTDKDASLMARCSAEFLPTVQAELHRSGLLDVEPIYNPRLRPGEERTLYRWPQSDQTESI